jgi:hypothetical protein
MRELLKGDRCLVIGATGNVGRGAALGLRVHELLLQFRVADGGPFPGMKSADLKALTARPYVG